MSSLDIRAKFDYAASAALAVATKNATTNLDHKITKDNSYLNGGRFIYQNAEWGDFISCQIVDVDNILGYGAGTVLKTYIEKWYIHPNETHAVCELPYAGHVPKNLYLRVKYTSVGTTNDVNMAINYHLHVLE